MDYTEVKEHHYYTPTCYAPLEPEAKYSEKCLWSASKCGSRRTAVKILELHKLETGHAWIGNEEVVA